MNEKSPLEKLPQEVLMHILTFIPTENLFRLPLVSKLFQNLLNTESLWKFKEDELLLQNGNEILFERVVFPQKNKKNLSVKEALYAAVASQVGRNNKWYHPLFLQVTINDSQGASDSYWKDKIQKIFKQDSPIHTSKEHCREILGIKKRTREEFEQEKSAEGEEQNPAKKMCLGYDVY